MPKEHFIHVPPYTKELAKVDKMSLKTWVDQSFRLAALAIHGHIFEIQGEAYIPVNLATIEPISRTDILDRISDADQVTSLTFQIPSHMIPLVTEHFLDLDEWARKTMALRVKGSYGRLYAFNNDEYVQIDFTPKKKD